MEHSQVREQVRKMHQELGILLSQMEAAEVPTAMEADPLEGKKVEGFYTSAVSTGLILGKQQLFFEPKNGVFCVATHRASTPHHLTRVTERTAGRFYLMEFKDGSHPTHFGLYLGEKNVGWIEDENYPLFIAHSFTGLSMYEVTVTP